MKRICLWVSAIAMIMALTGCISKKEFQALQNENNALKTENASLKQDNVKTLLQLTDSKANAKNLQEMLDAERKRNAELKDAYANLQSSLDKSLLQNSQGNINISKLVDEINASNRFIKQLVEAKDKSDSLNMVLTNNLTRSLTNAEKQEVDVQVLKGVVYISLADNMLYKSGS